MSDSNKTTYVPLDRINYLFEPNFSRSAQIILPIEIKDSHDEIEERPRELFHDALLESVLLHHLLPSIGVLLHEVFNGVRFLAGSCPFESEVFTDARPFISPGDDLAVRAVEDPAIAALVMVDGGVDVHLTKDVLERVRMLVSPAFWSARKWDFCTSAVDFSRQGQPKAESLRAIHEVRSRSKANDDVWSNLGKRPFLRSAHLLERVMLGVVEDTIVIFGKDLSAPPSRT